MTAAIAEIPTTDIDSKAAHDRARLLERLIRVSDAPTREQAWIWQGRIPAGELTAFVGPRGGGKSYLIAEIAAKVSTGDPWPDDPTTRREPGKVLIISAEDELVEGIKPRLAACGADLGKIHHFEARTTNDKDGQKFDLAIEDVARLAEAIPGLKLIVFDPFADALEAQNDKRTGALRAALAELKRLAAERGIAIILVNATDKVSAGRLGTRGYDVLPFLEARTRALWCVERVPGDRLRYFWLPVRTNLALAPLGLGFFIHPVSQQVVWEPEPVRLSPDDLKPRNRPSAKVARAAKWIKKYLEFGQRPSREVLRDAALAGITRGALYEGKAWLEVLSRKEAGKKVGCWHWKMPAPGQFDALHDALDDLKVFATLVREREPQSAAEAGEGTGPDGSEDLEDSKVRVEREHGAADAGGMSTSEGTKACHRGAMADFPSGSRVGTAVASSQGLEDSEDSKIRSECEHGAADATGMSTPQGTKTCHRGAMADFPTGSQVGRPAPSNKTTGRGPKSARGRRSEDSKVQHEAALAKLERTLGLPPVPGPNW